MLYQHISSDTIKYSWKCLKRYKETTTTTKLSSYIDLDCSSRSNDRKIGKFGITAMSTWQQNISRWGWDWGQNSSNPIGKANVKNDFAICFLIHSAHLQSRAIDLITFTCPSVTIYQKSEQISKQNNILTLGWLCAWTRGSLMGPRCHNFYIHLSVRNFFAEPKFVFLG